MLAFVLFANTPAFAQNTCGTNKITNGTFDSNLNDWTINSGWWRLVGQANMRIDVKGTHTVTSNTMNLCSKGEKIVKFNFVHHGGLATSYLKIKLGGQEIFHVDFSLGTTTLKTISGVTVTASDNVEGEVEIRITNYTGVSGNANLELEYYRKKAFTRLVILDDIEVYDIAPPKPLNPKKKAVEVCNGLTYNLTNLQPADAGYTYEWHTVGTNPSSATKVADPTKAPAGTYYLFHKTCDSCYSEAADDSVTITENAVVCNKGSFSLDFGNLTGNFPTAPPSPPATNADPGQHHEASMTTATCSGDQVTVNFVHQGANWKAYSYIMPNGNISVNSYKQKPWQRFSYTFSKAVRLNNLVVLNVDRNDEITFSADVNLTVTASNSSVVTVVGQKATANATTNLNSSVMVSSSEPVNTLTIYYRSTKGGASPRSIQIQTGTCFCCPACLSPVLSAESVVEDVTGGFNLSTITATNDTKNLVWYADEFTTTPLGSTQVIPGTYYAAFVGDGEGCRVPFTVHEDADKDGIKDDNDLDDDNDGILDSNEMYCDQTTAPNGTFPIGATPNPNIGGWAYPLDPSPGAYAKQLLFFDLTGVSIDENTIFPVERTVTHNGVTYTASIVNVDVSQANTGAGIHPTVIGADIENTPHVSGGTPPDTWEWQPPITNILYYYNVGGRTTFKEVLVTDGGYNGTVTFSIKLSAVKDGVHYPVEAVVFDGETISGYKNGGYERMIITTSGTPFKELELFKDTDYTYTPTYSTETVDGLNTKTLTMYDMDTPGNDTATNKAFGGLWTTTDLQPILNYKLIGNGSGNGIGFAIRLYCDADSDGIPNHLDLDSDNDGCPDAIEGGDNITASQLVTASGVTAGTGSTVNQNLCGGTGCVGSTGVPNSGVNQTTGQTVGGSQQAAKIDITEQLADQVVCKGNSATFTAKAVATVADGYDANNEPTYSTSTENVHYQWQVSADNGITWTNITGETGNVVSGTEVTYEITNAQAADNNKQFRVVFTSASVGCEEVTTAKLTVHTLDSDNDGIADYCDLDDDNDGILDTEECDNPVDPFVWSNLQGSGGGDTGLTINGSLNGMNISITDNSTMRSPRAYGGNLINGNGATFAGNAGIVPVVFNAIKSNGYSPNPNPIYKLLANPYDKGATYTFTFDNPSTEDVYLAVTALDGRNASNTQGTSVMLSNAIIVKTANGTGVGSSHFVPNIIDDRVEAAGFTALVPAGVTSFSITTSPLSSGGEAFVFALTNICSEDTDGDGIANRLDLDSDNDGCPDAIEGGDNITASQLVTASGVTAGTGSTVNQNLCGGTGCVGSTGVPNGTGVANSGVNQTTGQTVGGSQTAGKIEITEQPADTTICPNTTATFTAKATATKADGYNATHEPTYTPGTAENVNYQWQKWNGTAWVNATETGNSGTANSGDEVSYTTGNNTTANNGDKYRVVFTSSSINCPEESNEAVLTVEDNEKPVVTVPTAMSKCVRNIESIGTLSFSDITNGDVNTPPDYYEFETNDTSLDIISITDNCCGNIIADYTISWTITPASNGTTISGTGQPSTTIGGEKLWLDINSTVPKAGYADKTYTITYTVTDCNGNITITTTAITIKPRPKINRIE